MINIKEIQMKKENGFRYYDSFESVEKSFYVQNGEIFLLLKYNKDNLLECLDSLDTLNNKEIENVKNKLFVPIKVYNNSYAILLNNDWFYIPNHIIEKIKGVQNEI